MITDGAGRAISFALAPGQAHELPLAPDLVPWWRAAQTFIRWSHLGVWERLLERVQEHGVDLGMAFLDGTSIRAHHKAAGAPKKGDLERSATCVRRLAALAAAMAPRLA